MQKYWTIDSPPSEGMNPAAMTAYQDLLPYITKFLVAKHPYREGQVCPFASKAIEGNIFYFLDFAIGIDRLKAISDIKVSIDEFDEWQKKSNALGAFLLFFPWRCKESWLKKIHNETSLYANEKHLLLGIIHPDSPSHSFHSKNWFPLRAPYPMIIIRKMVANDMRHFSEFKSRKRKWYELF